MLSASPKKWLKAGIWQWFVVVAVSDWAALGNDFDWVYFIFFLIDVLLLFTSASVQTLQSGKNHTNTFYSQLYMLPYFSVTPQPFISFWCLQRHSEKDVYIFGQEIGCKISKAFLSFYVFLHLVRKQQIRSSWRGSKSLKNRVLMGNSQLPSTIFYYLFCTSYVYSSLLILLSNFSVIIKVGGISTKRTSFTWFSFC